MSGPGLHAVFPLTFPVQGLGGGFQGQEFRVAEQAGEDDEAVAQSCFQGKAVAPAGDHVQGQVAVLQVGELGGAGVEAGV